MITLFQIGKHRNYIGFSIDIFNIDLGYEERSFLGTNFGKGFLVIDVLFLRVIVYERS